MSIVRPVEASFLKAFALVGAVLLCTFALVSCGTSSAAVLNGRSADPDDEVSHEVRVAQATVGDVQRVISRSTVITAPVTVDLLPRIGGQITSLAVVEGQGVEAGALVAQIDDEQLRIAEQSARALRDKARHDCELAERKLEHSIIGREEYLQFRHAYEQSERDLQSAVIEREKAELRAPISGFISHRHVSVGDFVSTRTPVITIVNKERLEAIVPVPQSRISEVGIGDSVLLQPSGGAVRTIAGVVDRINPVIDPANGTVKVIVVVQGDSEDVRPGLFVRANIVTGISSGVTLVPRDAVFIENAISVIYKVIDGLARRIPVQVGFGGSDAVMVTGDVAPGDDVVVAGGGGLSDMVRVRVLNGSAE